MTTAMWGKIAFRNGHHDDDHHQGVTQPDTLTQAYRLEGLLSAHCTSSPHDVYAAVGQLRLDRRQHGCDASRVRLHQQDDDSR